MVDNNIKHWHDSHLVNRKEVIDNIPNNKVFDKASYTFKLISDPSRLKILWLLCHYEMCVNDLSISLNMSSPSVSHHLKLLKQAELIESRRQGKEMYYSLSKNNESNILHTSLDDILEIKCPK